MLSLQAPPPAAVRIGQRPALDPVADATAAAGVNASSTCSSPRGGSASGGQPRNVRQRTESWGPGGASGAPRLRRPLPAPAWTAL